MLRGFLKAVCVVKRAELLALPFRQFNDDVILPSVSHNFAPYTPCSFAVAFLTNPPAVESCPEVVAFCVLMRVSNYNWKEREAQLDLVPPGWHRKSPFSIDRWEKILHEEMTA